MSNANTNDTPIEFDDIDFEGVASAPSFETPPSGQYLVSVSLKQKLIGDDKKRAVEANFTLKEVIQIGQQHTEKPADEGQKFSVLYFVDTQEKYGYLKRDLRAFFEAVGTTSLNTLVAAVQDLPAKIVFSYSRTDYPKVDSYELV